MRHKTTFLSSSHWACTHTHPHTLTHTHPHTLTHTPTHSHTHTFTVLCVINHRLADTSFSHFFCLSNFLSLPPSYPFSPITLACPSPTPLSFAIFVTLPVSSHSLSISPLFSNFPLHSSTFLSTLPLSSPLFLPDCSLFLITHLIFFSCKTSIILSPVNAFWFSPLLSLSLSLSLMSPSLSHVSLSLSPSPSCLLHPLLLLSYIILVRASHSELKDSACPQFSSRDSSHRQVFVELDKEAEKGINDCRCGRPTKTPLFLLLPTSFIPHLPLILHNPGAVQAQTIPKTKLQCKKVSNQKQSKHTY